MRKRIWLAIFLIFSLYPLAAQEVEVTTINILNARQTSYKKADDTGNDTIVLEGSVELSVQKDSTVSEIKADRITYDRSTEMLYAEGNVEITTKGSSSGGETTTASSLLLNTSTLEGVFDGGRVVQTQTDALNLPSGSTLIVFSDLFGKGSENTIAFKNSSLTFCDEENPHWRIDATRTWLLPGGEFAFFNALLYVGSVPVLYLPAFYYPKDELIFNPVFNYRKREGYSVQTTTYVYGRKPLDSSSSSSSTTEEKSSASADALKGLYNFVKPSTLKEQRLEGLVLHNLDEDYSGNTSQYIKILGDWYSNLGYLVGLDASFQPENKYISKIALSADIGVSNTIFRLEDKNYYPFSAMGNTYKDYSTFLGVTMPFRYSANLEFALSKPFRLTLNFPLYSDPFYAYDFKTYRSETMDWISYLLDNITTTENETEPVVSEVSSFTWQLSSSVSPSIPDIFRPYVSSFSLNWNSSVNISSMTANSAEMVHPDYEQLDMGWTEYSPTRRFYYPSLVTPISTNISMSGTIFEWPIRQKSSMAKKRYSFPVTLNKPDELKSDRQLQEEAERAAEEQRRKEMKEKGEEEPEVKEETEKEEETEDLFQYYLPDLAYSPVSAAISEGLSYKLTYSASANITTQMAYSSANLKKSEDFDWEKVRSYMYTVKAPASLTSTLNYGGNFFSLENGLSYSPAFQGHPYISDDPVIGYTEASKNTLILSDYNAETHDVSNTNNVTFKPFTYFDIFSDTSFGWNSTIKVYRQKFIGDLDNPEWDYYSVDWDDEECITVNSLNQVLSAKEFNNKLGQSLTFTEVLPPLLRQYNATLGLTFPYVTANFSTGYQETSKDETVPEDERWKKSPFQQSLSVSIPVLEKNLSISESYNYNLEEEKPDSLKISTAWNGFSLSYVMSYTYGYDFEDSWVIREEEEFLPYSLSFSYATSSKTFYKWYNRISVAPALNTSVVADLIRPTNSYLLFSPSVTFKLNNFLDLTFSSTSRNSVLYWYFHNEAGDLYSDWGGFPGNVFKDLLDSYRFDDKSKREGSGFKLKSLNMTLSHDLHDWKFNMTLRIEPRMIVENGRKMYDFNPYMTIGIVWNPMESMKTSIVDEYGEWRLE